ncbi:MAG: NB-ARC domain-containing protein [Bacteroidales bacterium]
MKKNKAIVLTIVVLILGFLLNFLFEIMPDDFKKSMTDFSNSIGLSYTLFWIIFTLLVAIVTLYFVWKQALNSETKTILIPDETNTIKNTGKNSKTYQDIDNSIITDYSINQSYNGTGTGDNIGHDKITNIEYKINLFEKIPHELTQPPVKPDIFIGRDKDLENLRKEILNGDSLLLLVNGHGGIGKSTLAARYYHNYKNEYEHLAWLLSEKSIANALLRLKDNLGFSPDQNKLTIDEQLEIIITKLANLKKPSLLVIDNANELNDLEQNYLALKRCSNLHLMLTTRITKFDDVHCFKVEGLSEPFAIELFKKHYPNHYNEEDELLKEIIKNIDNNTLIIELLAKNLRELNMLESQYNLRQLADDLHQSLLKLSKSQKISTSYQANSHKLRVEKPEDIVMAMYDFTELNEAEKQMISVFTLLPNEAISFDFLKQSFPDQDIKTNLLSIAQKGWVDFNNKEMLFKVNQVIQDVAYENQKDRLFTDCKAMIEKLSSHLSGDDILHQDQFLFTQLLVNYAESIVNKIPDENEAIAVLNQSLGKYYTNTGDVTVSLTVYNRMNTIFQELQKSDLNNEDFKNGLAISYSKLGETHTALGNLDKALTYFEKDIELSKELYEAYPQNVSFKNGLAISYARFGVFHRDNLKNIKEAKLCFSKAQSLWKELVRQSPRNKEFERYHNQINIDLDNLIKR